MHPLLADVKTLVLDTLFPVYCLGCEQEGVFLCVNCQHKLQRLKYQQCIVCQMPSANGLTHQPCKRDGTPQGLISVFDYHDPLLAQAIIWGKYKFLPEVYRLLARLMIDYLRENGYDQLWSREQTVLCPIPLAKERLRWRGFNQSEIIAQELSREFGWPVIHAIKRIKNTKTQKDLTKTERLANVANSFALLESASITNLNLLLLDDVVTTGSTLAEAARLLQICQPQSIWALILARD